MAIKQVFEETIAKLVQEKDREVANVKNAVMQEIIVPNNQKIDNACSATVTELQQELNKKIAALQAEYAEKRQQVIDTATKEKNDFAESTINAHCAGVKAEYDTAIALLREHSQGGK